MQPEVASAVYPVFSYGLRLRDLVSRGSPPELVTAQKEIQGLLQQVMQAGKAIDGNIQFRPGDSLSFVSKSPDSYLGVTYPLVCWLDEILIDSPWRSEWTEKILEHKMFGCRDRGWKFWEQAKRAENLSAPDALEVFYLAVILGFRGDYAGNFPRLNEFLTNVRTLLEKTEETDPPLPVDGKPITYVPALKGVGRKKRMLLFASILLVILVPVVAFLAVYFLGN